jgi:GNAT superfamily N-acetyltransferase
MGDKPLRFEPLGGKHLSLRAAFSCGLDVLDQYLHQRARKEMEQGLVAVRVLHDTEGDRIAGYHTLSAISVEPRELPNDVTTRLPPYAVLPAMLIGRLAVDTHYRGRGLGRLLLMDALRRALDLTEQVAAVVVIVDARDDDAVHFYERHDFRRLIDHERRLFISMKTVAQVLQPAKD